MAGKKASRKKTAAKKSARKKKTAAARSSSVSARKILRKRKSAAGKKALAKSKSRKRRPVRRSRGRAVESGEPFIPRRRGLGPDAGGQSGDVQGLRGTAVGDSESVEELVEDGQAYEAEVVSGVEDAPDADQGEIRTREVTEDDVPSEYLDNQ